MEQRTKPEILSPHPRDLCRDRDGRSSDSPVLLLEHADHDDFVCGIDPERGAMNAAPVEGSRADCAAIEIGVRWIEHDANVDAIADTRQRPIEMH